MISAVPNRFKYHQNAPFTVFYFLIFFSAVPNHFKYGQNAPFSVLICSFFSEVQNRIKYHQNAPFIVFFFSFSVVSNRFDCRQNAPFTVLIFNFSLRLPTSSCFPWFWYKICKQILLQFQISFKIVSNGKL